MTEKKPGLLKITLICVVMIVGLIGWIINWREIGPASYPIFMLIAGQLTSDIRMDAVEAWQKKRGRV